MSKYVLLVLINIPLLTVGIISAITSYKTKRISKRRATLELLFWAGVGVGLVFVEPVYNQLIKHNLTNSQPMSLFDIVLLTLILFCMLMIKNSNERISALQRKISRMHENLAIEGAEHPRGQDT